MKIATAFKTLVFTLAVTGSALANNTYGSVEPIINAAVVNTGPLKEQRLAVRKAFADRALQCGVVDKVMTLLISSRSVTTINSLNTRFEVGAGGFAGQTNPSYVYTVVDSGPNAASQNDIKVLTDGLGFVLSQASAFLLDADNENSFDFPAQYVVLNFASPPSLGESAHLFQTVGRIDRELFATDSSGYTQYGRAYLSLQSFVPDAQFIDGYVRAAAAFGVEYTPIVGGTPGLFLGGAAFPGNDWTASPNGEEYLARIPAESHKGLQRLRQAHVRLTAAALKAIAEGGADAELRRKLSELPCQ